LHNIGSLFQLIVCFESHMANGSPNVVKKHVKSTH